MLCSQNHRHCMRLRKAPLMKRDKKWIPLLNNIDVEAERAVEEVTTGAP